MRPARRPGEPEVHRPQPTRRSCGVRLKNNPATGAHARATNRSTTVTHNDPLLNLDTLNSMDRAAFVAALGSTFEHSPWVAEQAWQARPFASIEAVHGAMLDVVRRSPRPVQIDFLCAHPELAGREAQTGTMTADSVHEQRSAGLDALSRDELLEMKRLNGEYRRRHGFPFIIAARTPRTRSSPSCDAVSRKAPRPSSPRRSIRSP